VEAVAKDIRATVGCAVRTIPKNYASRTVRTAHPTLLLQHPPVGEGMHFLIAECGIHVQRVSNIQITTFIHDHTGGSINVIGQQ
jgi:hypothetical protein